jgi:3-dehydroquinate dehydratase/shikimate dehydrogenase
LDAAWPLLAAVAKKRDLPVVGMGLGREGVMFSLLGQKYGAPWVYAALEKGLEAFAGQPTVTEMEEVFHYREINPQTRFVAVAGFGPAESTTVRAFNTAFAAQGLNVRCLPLEIGISGKAQQMLDNLNINLVVCNPALAERSLNLAEKMEESARKAQYADLLVKQADGWQAFNTGWKSVLRVLEAGLGARAAEDRPLDRRNVLIIGTGGLAKSVAYGVQRRQGLLSVTGADDAEARQFAQLNNARYIPVANLYDTLCDVVVLADVQRFDSMTGLSSGTGLKLNPAFLRTNMHVIDLTQLVGESPLTREARLRGAKVISGEAVFADMVSQTYKAISGKDLAPAIIEQALEAERPMDVAAE